MLQTAQSLTRLGTESAFQIAAQVEQARQAGHDVINLGIGQPDFNTAPHIVEAAMQALRDNHHGYTLPQGIVPLRETVSDYLHQRYQQEISPDNILIVPGGKVTMFLAITLFGAQGAEIIYPNPGFPIYESMINYSGAKAIAYPLQEADDFALDADKILSLITPQTRLLIINNPSNPTGGVTPKTELDKLVQGLEQHPHVAILADEIYAHHIYDDGVHHSFLQYPQLRDRLILLDGWSKTWAMTGWRAGYGVWPTHLMPLAIQLCINIHSCVNHMTQYASIAAMKGPQTHVADMVQKFDERRKFLHRAVNESDFLSCVMPKGGFYAFVNIKKLGESSAFWQDEILHKAHVGLIAGTSFGYYGEGYLRLSYAIEQEKIAIALNRIDDFLHQLKL
ncbi:MAG: aminotransferase class I/II-fold pyridoxal phosphate-dependent enzyme [Alphaproteobacteria bacterium]|nr:aminotransferase class I/II-fold pyridoxal phosphate-dependent enzyme [Alphaproteobacteria bacterium]